MASNKELGNELEKRVCEILTKNFGFWTHRLTQSAAGQPADVIAVGNDIAHLIECKYISGKRFGLSRIEQNQITSNYAWGAAGNRFSWVAFGIGEDIVMIEFDTVLDWINDERKTVTVEEIYKYCCGIDEWGKDGGRCSDNWAFDEDYWDNYDDDFDD